MEFVFNSTEDGPHQITLYGYSFVKGQPTEVREDHTFEATNNRRLLVVDKLKNHPLFKAVESKKAPNNERGPSTQSMPKTTSKKGS